MRSGTDARLGTGEPSLPLSQRMRATSSQRPAPTFARRGIQWKRKRPRSPTRTVPIRKAFWSDLRDSRTVRLQNSITGQPLPVIASVSPKRTGLGDAATDSRAAAGAASARLATTASTSLMPQVAMRATYLVFRPLNRVAAPHANEEERMAELTVLEEKVAEVIGLAMAAQGATEKVERLTEDEELTQKLEQMRDEARETEERGTAYAEELDGKKTAVLEKARETKSEATEMMSTYLGDDSDDLDGFEFLTMAEAGEVGHWAILGKLNEQAGDPRLRELVDWALPIQERHFEDVKAGSLKLAAEEDPTSPA
ncbi:MAG: hypothetical protein QOE60_646 [Thermoleophilaceae bacterium]|nr:hypothetical protein [Thermoleophilaceae bacterium]